MGLGIWRFGWGWDWGLVLGIGKGIGIGYWGLVVTFGFDFCLRLSVVTFVCDVCCDFWL